MLVTWKAAVAGLLLMATLVPEGNARSTNLVLTEVNGKQVSKRACAYECKWARWCSHAYFYHSAEPPACRLTDDPAPHTTMKGIYEIYSKHHGRYLVRADLPDVDDTDPPGEPGPRATTKPKKYNWEVLPKEQWKMPAIEGLCRNTRRSERQVEGGWLREKLVSNREAKSRVLILLNEMLKDAALSPDFASVFVRNLQGRSLQRRKGVAFNGGHLQY